MNYLQCTKSHRIGTGLLLAVLALTVAGAARVPHPNVVLFDVRVTTTEGHEVDLSRRVKSSLSARHKLSLCPRNAPPKPNNGLNGPPAGLHALLKN